MRDPIHTTHLDIGAFKIIAEILRHERGLEKIDYDLAAVEIAAAVKRLGGKIGGVLHAN